MASNDPIDDDDALLEALAQCNLPARPRLQEAHERLARCSNGRHGWEQLLTHGLLPESWLDHPHRRFVLSNYVPEEPLPPGVRRCSPVRGLPATYVGPCPLRRPEAMLFAADVANIEAAEALAREATERLFRWLKNSAPREILWQSQGNVHESNMGLCVQPGASALLAKARSALELNAGAVVERNFWLAFRARAADLHPRKGMLRDALAARDYRAAQSQKNFLRAYLSPFEPAFELWKLGYCIGNITNEFITLLMPPRPSHTRFTKK